MSSHVQEAHRLLSEKRFNDISADMWKVIISDLIDDDVEVTFQLRQEAIPTWLKRERRESTCNSLSEHLMPAGKWVHWGPASCTCGTTCPSRRG